jgi:MyTH4 domain-containing protein
VIRQVRKNPDKKSRLLGWELLMFLTGAFAPSKRFQPYTRGFFLFIDDATLETEDIKGLPARALARLLATVQANSRTRAPSRYRARCSS